MSPAVAHKFKEATQCVGIAAICPDVLCAAQPLFDEAKEFGASLALGLEMRRGDRTQIVENQ
jgi:hypothetical protein